MVFIFITLTIFVSDYFVKSYIESNKEYGEEKKIFNGHVIINKSHNKGAMLNFLEDRKNTILYVSSILLGILLLVFGLLLLRRGRNLVKLGLAFVIGGASSNVYDRIKNGYVIDYFSFKRIKNIVFNLSDLSIFIGSFMIVIYSIFKKNS